MDVSALPVSVLMEKLSPGAPRGEGPGRRIGHTHGERPAHDDARACCPQRTRGHAHGLAARPGRALDVLRLEIRTQLRSELHVRVTDAPPAALTAANEPDPAALTTETLAAARRLTQEDPASAAATIDTFRAAVRDAATQTRAALGNDDGGELDDAVARIDAGLDALDNETATQRAASTSVLDLDVQTRQRTTLRIRTQEGDVVMLDLRRVDRLSADSVGASTADGAAAAASVELSSRSRLRLRVEGDLNAAELDAIRDILAQAEDAANRFSATGGRSVEGLAATLNIDGEQLAAVDLRLRTRQTAKLDYSAVRVPQAATTPSQSEPVPSTAQAPATIAPAADVGTAGGAEKIAQDTTAAVSGDAAGAPPAPHTPSHFASSASAVPPPADDPHVVRFLHGVASGFGGNEGGVSVRYHYTQSFKLTLLQAVAHVLAPDASDTTSPARASVDTTTGDAPAQATRAA